jgi:hypothetical protein
MVQKGKFNLFEYNGVFSEEIQLFYKGPFESQVITLIGGYINLVLNTDPDLSRKLFKIFMELAQNIAYYSAENKGIRINTDVGVGNGMLLIREGEDKVFFHAGNVVMTEDVIPIIDKCEYINSLDREALRNYKREQRSLPPGIKGGAHIGLIQVALTSANPLDIEVTPIDESRSFFSVTVLINKN